MSKCGFYNIKMNTVSEYEPMDVIILRNLTIKNICGFAITKIGVEMLAQFICDELFFKIKKLDYEKNTIIISINNNLYLCAFVYENGINDDCNTISAKEIEPLSYIYYKIQAEIKEIYSNSENKNDFIIKIYQYS